MLNHDQNPIQPIHTKGAGGPNSLVWSTGILSSCIPCTIPTGEFSIQANIFPTNCITKYFLIQLFLFIVTIVIHRNIFFEIIMPFRRISQPVTPSFEKIKILEPSNKVRKLLTAIELIKPQGIPPYYSQSERMKFRGSLLLSLQLY